MAPAAGTEKATFASIRGQVRDWLLEAGWKIEEKADKNVSWALICEPEGGAQHVHLYQSHVREDVVFVTGGIKPSPNHAAKLQKMDAKELGSLRWDLQFELLRMGIEFSVQGRTLDQIGLQRTVFWDEGMNRSSFWEGVGALLRGIVAVQWLIQRHLDEPIEATAQTVGPN